jgi:hypothetical protein
MRLLGLWPLLAVLVAGAAVTVPLVLAGHRPEEIKMNETTSLNPSAASRYEVATFALG